MYGRRRCELCLKSPRSTTQRSIRTGPVLPQTQHESARRVLRASQAAPVASTAAATSVGRAQAGPVRHAAAREVFTPPIPLIHGGPARELAVWLVPPFEGCSHSTPLSTS